jgi:hypothetical protein
MRKHFQGPVKWVVLTILGGFLATALFYATGWPPDRVVDRIRWSVEHRTLTSQPTCDDPGWLREMEIKRAVALQLPNRDTHPVKHAWDGDPATAWWQKWPVPGPSKLALVFAKSAEEPKLVCVTGGWAADEATYAMTAQPKKIKLVVPGCRPKTVKVPDFVSPEGTTTGAYDSFSIPFSCEADGSADPPGDMIVDLFIKSIHPPDKPENQQVYVAISEVRFYS